mmetsp:Transcript_12374/g.12406  ORF Transcript_12374/g.12406 Transcript_12374/m.12406 type:complete len:92 (-) Transcript_12374:45-320(-)
MRRGGTFVRGFAEVLISGEFIDVDKFSSHRVLMGRSGNIIEFLDENCDWLETEQSELESDRLRETGIDENSCSAVSLRLKLDDGLAQKLQS